MKLDYLLSSLFKLCICGPFEENPKVTGGFPKKIATLMSKMFQCQALINSEYGLCSTCAIDLIHKSQTAPVLYPTMLHSEQKCAHFCSDWCIVGYGTSESLTLKHFRNYCCYFFREATGHLWILLKGATLYAMSCILVKMETLSEIHQFWRKSIMKKIIDPWIQQIHTFKCHRSWTNSEVWWNII